MRADTRRQPRPLIAAVALAVAMLAVSCGATSHEQPATGDPDASVAALLERIEALERQVQALQRAPGTVRAQRFELVDSAGAVRAVLAVDPEGHAGLLLRDVAGQDAIWLGVRGERWADSRVLRFNDAAGTVMLSLNSAPDLGSFVFMSDRPTPDGYGTNQIHLETTWRSSVELRRREGCAALITDGDGGTAYLSLRDLTDDEDERDPGCRLIQE